MSQCLQTPRYKRKIQYHSARWCGSWLRSLTWLVDSNCCTKIQFKWFTQKKTERFRYRRGSAKYVSHWCKQKKLFISLNKYGNHSRLHFRFQGAVLLGNTDFTKPESQESIKKLLDGRQINCVLSDMAPNATGVRCLDQENITKLCYSVLRFAVLMSSPDASCLVKLWDNGDVQKLEKDMLRFYKTVKRVKPPASRSDSAEMFLLARGFAGRQAEPKTWCNWNQLGF